MAGDAVRVTKGDTAAIAAVVDELRGALEGVFRRRRDTAATPITRAELLLIGHNFHKLLVLHVLDEMQREAGSLVRQRATVVNVAADTWARTMDDLFTAIVTEQTG